jgi:NAD(P)-dependent dehydrogenase (short-subunit alcohol dehydrogenase family)
MAWRQVRMKHLVGAALAIVVAALSRRGELLWCHARGIKLGTLFLTPGFSLDRMPDLRGKVAIVTGANTGLGLEVAKQLVLANATVVLACRDASKCDHSRRHLDHLASTRHISAPRVRSLVLDLDDLASVGRFASDVEADLRRASPAGEEPQLDLLINNAGVAAQYPVQLTADGVERTFQSHYLGHFALTMQLLPLLRRCVRKGGERARVVHLTSGAHRAAPAAGIPLSLAAINDDGLGGITRYAIAKLGTLVFARELARRADEEVISHAVHPGVVASEMLRQPNFDAMLGPRLGAVAWRVAQARNALFAYSAPEAALTVLYPAVAPELAGGRWPAGNGQLFVPVATRWEPRHPMASSMELSSKLWDFTHSLLPKSKHEDRM